MYFEYKTLGTEYILVFLYLTKQLCINKKNVYFCEQFHRIGSNINIV